MLMIVFRQFVIWDSSVPPTFFSAGVVFYYEAVARVTGADRLKAWLPRLWDAREFRLDDRELTAMAYELMLCCTVGSPGCARICWPVPQKSQKWGLKWG